MSIKRPASSAREFLKGNTFFGSLSDDLITRLVERGVVRSHARGKVLFEHGDLGDALWVVLSGSVKVVNIVGDGRLVVLNFLGAGGILGEIAALDGGTRTATAIVLEPTEVFMLYRRDLLPVLRQSPDALFKIMQVLCKKLRVTSEMVEDGTREMQGRFAAGLRRLAKLHGRNTGRGLEVNLIANQGELGDYFRLSRENTSRLINRLQSQGIIDVDGRRLIIKDDTALTGAQEQ